MLRLSKMLRLLFTDTLNNFYTIMKILNITAEYVIASDVTNNTQILYIFNPTSITKKSLGEAYANDSFQHVEINDAAGTLQTLREYRVISAVKSVHHNTVIVTLSSV